MLVRSDSYFSALAAPTMLLNHGFAQPLQQPLRTLLLATLISALPLAASANPPMVPQHDAQTAFGGALPARDAALLDAGLASHIERQQLLNSQHLAGSQLRTLDFFNKTFTVLRGGKRTVFDAELLGTWWPESKRWAWEAVERVPDLKDPKRKSFATGSALTRLYGREHGIDILQADTAQLASEEAAWYLCAITVQLNQASGVLVSISSELVAGGAEGQKAVVKRYYLLSHPKVTDAPTGGTSKAQSPAR